MKRPLVIDLFAGRFGWSRGFVANGWRSVGFDMVHEPHHGPVPEHCELVLQDVRTIHGSQFRHADCIVASPPCTEYSYMAQPWRRGKQIAASLRGKAEFPDKYAGSRNLAQLNELFNACFRIQLEASQAAGRHIPMVVENVKGAQPWVGRAQANFGSFYLWGDIASVGGRITSTAPQFGQTIRAARRRGRKVPGMSWSGYGTPGYVGLAFNGEAARRIAEDGQKNDGGSWFNIASPGQKETGQKVQGFNFHEHEKTGKPGRSFQSAGVKAQAAGDGVEYGGFGWDGSGMRTGNSKSPARKAASAMIAQIPFELSCYVARIFKPTQENRETA